MAKQTPSSTLSTLETNLNNAISGGTIVLNEAAVGSGNQSILTDLYAAMNFPIGSTITLSGATCAFNTVKTTLNLKGILQTPFLGLGQASVNCAFSVDSDNGALILEMYLTPDDIWNITQSFPELYNTYISNLQFKTMPIVIYCSQALTDPTYGALSDGLNFSADIELLKNSFEAALLEFDSSVGSDITVTGPLVLSQEGGFTLQVGTNISNQSMSFTTPPLKFDFNGNEFGLSIMGMPQYPSPYYAFFISSQITLSGTGPASPSFGPLGIRLQFPTSITSWCLDLDTVKPFSASSPFTFLQTLTGVKFNSLLPQEVLSALSDVEIDLEDLKIRKVKNEDKIEDILAVVSFTKKRKKTQVKASWELIPHILELTELQGVFYHNVQADTSTINITGNFELGNDVDLFASLSFPVTKETIWSIGSYCNYSLSKLDVFDKLFGGGSNVLGRLLPNDSLAKALSDFEFNLLEMNIAPEATGSKKLAGFQIAMSTANPWNLIDNQIVLESLSLNLNVQDPTDSSSRELYGTVRAQLKLKTIYLNTQISKLPGSDWMVDICTDNIALPSLDELTNLAGGFDFTKAFPTSLMEASFTLGLPKVVIDVSKGKIHQLSFFLGTPSIGMDVNITWPKSGGMDVTISGKIDNLPLSSLIQQLFADLDIDFDILPDMALSDTTLDWNSTDKRFVVSSNYTIEGTTGSFKLTAQKNKTTQKWEFVGFSTLNLPESLDIGKLIPVVGGDIKGEVIFGNLTLLITSKNPTGISTNGIHVEPGGTFAATMTIGKIPYPLVIPIFRYKKPSNGQSSEATNTSLALGAPSTANQKSTPGISIQKQIGPVYIQSIQPEYKKANGQIVVGLGLTASLKIGALTGSFYDLSVALNTSNFEPSVSLDGIGFGYNNDSMQISGTFLKAPSKEAFSGELTIEANALSLTAIGEFGKDKSGNTFFDLFVLLRSPLGGPPSFFVNGLAAGMGYNSVVNIPQSITSIKTFPFVEAALSVIDPTVTSPFSQGNSPTQNMSVLSGTKPPAITEEVGEDWFTAGVTFNSFETLNSFAAITVDLGNTLEIGLIGLSTISIPANDPDPVSLVEVELDATYQPKHGYFTLLAHVADSSYVFDRDCKLTGDLVMDYWFSPNSHAGDFVITLGGYDPSYTPPSYYPQHLKQLGLSWQIDSNTNITGGLYFALTPIAIMAGGSLNANWHSGPFSAGINLWANFLIEWKPFHYDISLGVQIWAEASVSLFFFTIHLSVHLGASLHIWGPKFAGEATIHLYIVSFTVSFGAASTNHPPGISWHQLIDDFFPKDANNQNTPKICSGSVSQGLHTHVSDKEGATLNWVVSSDTAQFSTETALPSTGYSITKPVSSMGEATDNTATLAQTHSSGPYVRQMNPKSPPSLTAQHRVWIEFKGSAVKASDLDITPRHSNVPSALWSNYQGADRTQGNNNLIGNMLTGLTITPTHQAPDTLPPISNSVLEFEYVPTSEDPSFRFFEMGEITQQPAPGTVNDTILKSPTESTRNALVGSMTTLFNWSGTPTIDLNVFKEDNLINLYQDPNLRVLGYEEAST